MEWFTESGAPVLVIFLGVFVTWLGLLGDEERAPGAWAVMIIGIVLVGLGLYFTFVGR